MLHIRCTRFLAFLRYFLLFAGSLGRSRRFGPPNITLTAAEEAPTPLYPSSHEQKAAGGTRTFLPALQQ